MIKCAVIGGSGFYGVKGLSSLQEGSIDTPYGRVDYTQGLHGKREVVFIARHGKNHSSPPHLINYRANIMALKLLGVDSILASAASGGLSEKLEVGDLVLLDQFMDFTKSRPSTFFAEGNVAHVDMTHPYCPSLRSHMIKTAKSGGIDLSPKGTYVCTEGPRLETMAEINSFKILGADLVGMTGYPEVALAREAEICYATVAVVTNMAAGISDQTISSKEILGVMAGAMDRLVDYFLEAISSLDERGPCGCREAMRGTEMTKA